jgi:ATP-dependent DNA helicase RecQ
MKKKQLQAGFIIDPIINAIENSREQWGKQLRQILNRLSYFDVIEDPPISKKVKAKNTNSQAAVFSNFLSRGLPTRTSPFICKAFTAVFNEIKFSEDSLGGFSYAIDQDNEELIKRLVQTFCLIEPRSSEFNKLEINTWENHLGSEYEERFLYQIVPQIFGGFAIQLFETQKNINALIDFTLDYHQDLEELINRPIDDFQRQRLDFSLEFPFQIKGKKGIVIEIDGSQHEEKSQNYLDGLRDDALRKIGWEVFRLKTNQFGRASTILKPLQEFFKHPYFKKLKNKYDNNFLLNEQAKKDLTIFGSPLLVARIQKVILDLILTETLDINSEIWNIGILERDVPASYVAIKDLEKTFGHLSKLAGRENNLPIINLSIYGSQSFRGNSFEQHFDYMVNPLSEINNFKGDVFLDVSLLQKTGLTSCPSHIKANNRITIRSAHSINSYRNIINAPLVSYKSLTIDQDSNNVQESLHYFLHYFFRKKKFRPGQIEIIDRAIQGKSVIGLLPTGGGKSLTYQMCSLLQPGTAIVVDPIKSLMKDQYDGLIKNYIDAVVFINSSIKTQLQRNIAERKLMNGEILFAFVSPERFQINKFRTQLHEMHHDRDKFFNYCVIDEAHCVSEWGHDFRTSYLRLGENVRNHCKSLSSDSISLFGLTATASFDVLSDVKRELDLEEEDVVIRESERRELFFNVIQSKTVVNRDDNDFEIRQAIGLGKQQKLNEILNSLPENIENISSEELKPHEFSKNLFYKCGEFDKFKHSILVFCPYKSDKINIGVKSVAANLSNEQESLKVGTFYGSDGMDENSNNSEQYQDEFVKNKANVLVATKAFGMGIDKPNIRATIHINFPSSIESFVQESGRAGRDGKAALCSVIISDQAGADKAIPEGFHATNFKGKEKEKSILMELLREITLPIQNQMNRLAEYIFENTGHYVKINLWTKDEPSRVYINTGFKKGFGFIKVNGLLKNTHTVYYPLDDCNMVLNSAISFLREENKDNVPIKDFLNQIVAHNPLPGIESLLNNINIGDELDNVMLGFRNDRITRITELLQIEVDPNFTELIISDASQYALRLNEFIRSLKGKFKNYTGDWPSGNIEEVEGQLAPLFYEIRNEQDTYKAIYRLSIIGVVDDYVVDYNSKTLSLKISKKKNADYIESFRNYLGRYLSNSKVEEKINSLSNYNGSIIQKCLKCLIDFVYQEIGKKRFSAISSMEEACQTGLIKGGRFMKEYIELYFRSKFLEELKICTHNGKEFTPDILWDFIKKAGSSIDSWNHLRGSSTRLLNDHPNNGTLLLLRSYSVILLESNIVFIERAQEDLINGVIAFEENGYDIDEILIKLKEAIKKQNEAKVLIVEDCLQLISIKKHTIWLKNFNEKFNNHESKIAS